MTTRDVTDGIGHCQHCQTERESDTEKANSKGGKASRQNCGATATQYQPERSKELGDNAPRHVVVHCYPPTLTSYTFNG